MSSKKLVLGICGSTQRTVGCAEVLRSHPDFEIAWVITPPPKPVGREQALTPSPVDIWAMANNIPVKHVEKKLSEIQTDLLESQKTNPIDILFVVDFGYLIPPWLLELPRIGPVNVHPSDLPKWRGSSPGQFSLLYGDTQSAVCIMRLVWELDAGPVLKRLPFAVPATMTQTEYYATAFALAQEHLAETIRNFAENGQEKAQPVDSPTPVAGRLERKDGFVPFAVIEQALQGDAAAVPATTTEFTEVIQTLLSAQSLAPAQLLQRMMNAFSPWPGVWTLAPQYKDRLSVRLKLLAGEMRGNTYVVTQWQYEGEQAKTGELSF